MQSTPKGELTRLLQGFSWTEFKTNWSSGADEHVGTVEQLTGHLKEIIETEIERAAAGELPEAACAPIMQRKVFKPLGALTPQAAALTSPFLELSEEELRTRVAARRQELQAAGEIDDLKEEQPDNAPSLDASLHGFTIEVRWRYWRPAQEGEKGKKKQEFIWCEGEVMDTAAAESVRIQPKLKKELIVGETAVRIKWPKDDEFEEAERCIWTVLKPEDFNQQVHLGWHLTAASMTRLREECTPEKEKAPPQSHRTPPPARRTL